MTDLKEIRWHDVQRQAIPLSRRSTAEKEVTFLLAHIDAMEAAADMVVCTRCDGTGDINGIDGNWFVSCPDCTPLRNLIGEAK